MAITNDDIYQLVAVGFGSALAGLSGIVQHLAETTDDKSRRDALSDGADTLLQTAEMLKSILGEEDPDGK